MSEVVEQYAIEDAEIVAMEPGLPLPQSTFLAVRNEAVQVGLTNESSFSLAQRAANLLCSSSLVPAIYQGKDNMANCVIALHMAARMKADPLMVMQNLYVIQGKPSWSSQFLIATFNSCGQFSKLRYKMTGTKGQDNYGCIAYATELATGEVLEGAEVTVAIAKAEGWFSKAGSKWKTMPEQMLKYRAAAWFIRSVAPELAMGLHTADEVDDFSSLDVPATPKTVEPPKPPMNPMELLKQQQQKAASVVESQPETTAAIAQALQQPTQPTKPTQPTSQASHEPGYCTPEQKQRIEQLFQQCGYDLATQTQILEKRKVGAVRSLTEEQAAQLIANMEAKLAAAQAAVAQPAETQSDESENVGLFSGGAKLQPGEQSRDVNGPCSVEQIKAIENALLEFEQLKPGITAQFVANCADREMHVSDLTYAQADALLAHIKVNEMQVFFDQQLAVQTAG